MRREYGETIVAGVLADLQRLGYLDDAKFATAKASERRRASTTAGGGR